MKALILSAMLLSSAAVFAATSPVGTVKMHANQHSCSEFAQAIQRYGKIVVVYFGGLSERAFYASSHSCHFSQKPVARHFKGKNGEQCYLRWACEFDHSDR